MKDRIAHTHWQVISRNKPSSVDELLLVILENRNVDASFMSGALKDLEVHLSMHGMEEGAELMSRHLSLGSKIVLVGDYDCDGITSVTQMSLFLRDIGYSRFETVIPNRSDGYGFPGAAVEDHPDARLFVAMDCGSSDVDSISRARSLGADVIVLDHHEVSLEGRAPANVIINPKQPGCSSPFKGFCASGLTLLFLAKLRRLLPSGFPEPPLGGKYLVLAALGTVADVVPLVDGNRILTQRGLHCLNARTYEPMNALIRQAGLWNRTPLTAGHLGYYLGPLINAAGRMDQVHLAYDLLMSQCAETIHNGALALSALNAQRQELVEGILQSIRATLKADQHHRRSLVLSDPSWPSGLAGIVASRLQREIHYGPAVVLSVDPQGGTARGSVRSIPGINIHQALERCAHLLSKWGGHDQAAGMTIEIGHIPEFARCFEEVMQTHPADCFIPVKTIDALIDLDLVTPELLDGLQQLEPHGMGNPTPTFGAMDIGIESAVPFGRNGGHMRLKLRGGLKAVFWGGADVLSNISRAGSILVDAAFQLERDPFDGQPLLNLKGLGSLFRG